METLTAIMHGVRLYGPFHHHSAWLVGCAKCNRHHPSILGRCCAQAFEDACDRFFNRIKETPDWQTAGYTNSADALSSLLELVRQYEVGCTPFFLPCICLPRGLACIDLPFGIISQTNAPSVSGFMHAGVVDSRCYWEQVNLPGHICAVVVTTLVLEGWSSQLDPAHSTLTEVQKISAISDQPAWQQLLAQAVDRALYTDMPRVSDLWHFT